MKTLWSVIVGVALLQAAGPGKAEQGLVLAQTGSQERQQQAGRPLSVGRVAVVRPAEGEVVASDLKVVLEMPPDTEARSFSLEVAYFDAGRNRWFYPGLLGSDFAGGPQATRTIQISELARFSATATQWQIRARVTDPPGPWSAWRNFVLGQAPGLARESNLPVRVQILR
jgi:hypothetical protein